MTTLTVIPGGAGRRRRPASNTAAACADTIASCEALLGALPVGDPLRPGLNTLIRALRFKAEVQTPLAAARKALGGRERSSSHALGWDAQAEYDIGVMIRRYLAEHPPPAGSRSAGFLENCAEDLIVSGDARLGALGARPLAPVGGDGS
jgi:hypothetical protein